MQYWNTMEEIHNGEKMNMNNFSFDVVDDKIELIDISAEDDGFLISSAMFDSLEELRLSVTMEPSRPSYLRRSLAWDTAFFNSAGFLDPDELSFVNKEFDSISARILPDLRARRTDSESRLDAFKNVKVGSKSRPKQISLWKIGDIERSRKAKNEFQKMAKSGEAAICSCKPPSSGKREIYNKQRKRDSLRRSDTTTGSGSGLNLITTTNAASPSGSLFSKKTESKKSKLTASFSTSKKGLGNTSWSTRSLSALDCSSRTPPTRVVSDHLPSVSMSSTNQKFKGSTTKFSRTAQPKDAKVAPDLQNKFNPVELSFCALSGIPRVGSESPKTSGLRMPSPKIGYFDETTFPSSTGTTRRKATHQKILSENKALGKELSSKHLPWIRLKFC